MDRVPKQPRQTPPDGGDPSLPVGVLVALRRPPGSAKPIPEGFDRAVLSAAAREIGALERADLAAAAGASEGTTRDTARTTPGRRRVGALSDLFKAHPRASLLAAASVMLMVGVAWFAWPGGFSQPPTLATENGSFAKKSEALASNELRAERSISRGLAPSASHAPEADAAPAAVALTPLSATMTPTIVDAFRLARAVHSGEAVPAGWDLTGDGTVNDDDVRELAMRAVRLEGRFSQLSPQQQEAVLVSVLAQLNLKTSSDGGGA